MRDVEQITEIGLKRRKTEDAGQCWPLVAWLPHRPLLEKNKMNFKLTLAGRACLPFQVDLTPIEANRVSLLKHSSMPSPKGALPSLALSNSPSEAKWKVKEYLASEPLNNTEQCKETKKVKVATDEFEENSANLTISRLSITYCWPLIAWEPKAAFSFNPLKKQPATTTLAHEKEKVKVKKRKADELVNESKRLRFSAILAITYCWPILPWVAPAAIESLV